MFESLQSGLTTSLILRLDTSVDVIQNAEKTVGRFR